MYYFLFLLSFDLFHLHQTDFFSLNSNKSSNYLESIFKNLNKLLKIVTQKKTAFKNEEASLRPAVFNVASRGFVLRNLNATMLARALYPSYKSYIIFFLRWNIAPHITSFSTDCNSFVAVSGDRWFDLKSSSDVGEFSNSLCLSEFAHLFYNFSHR